MENPIKMDDLGVPLFLETPTFSKITWHLRASGILTLPGFDYKRLRVEEMKALNSPETFKTPLEHKLKGKVYVIWCSGKWQYIHD